MRYIEDITPALQAVLRSWATGDTSCWVSFVVDESKVPGIDSKWSELYGTRLSAEKRRWRRSKNLPTAWAASLPVLGAPHKRQLVLMASTDAMQVGDQWAREKWRRDPPEVSDFVLVREPRERGDYAWTWRIQQRQAALVEQHLISLIKSGDAAAAFQYSLYVCRFYPMFGGVRRQLRRMLRAAAKLWIATQKSAWGGQAPDALPAMVGFRREDSPKSQQPRNSRRGLMREPLNR